MKKLVAGQEGRERRKTVEGKREGKGIRGRKEGWRGSRLSENNLSVCK